MDRWAWWLWWTPLQHQWFHIQWAIWACFCPMLNYMSDHAKHIAMNYSCCCFFSRKDGTAWKSCIQSTQHEWSRLIPELSELYLSFKLRDLHSAPSHYPDPVEGAQSLHLEAINVFGKSSAFIWPYPWFPFGFQMEGTSSIFPPTPLTLHLCLLSSMQVIISPQHQLTHPCSVKLQCPGLYTYASQYA